MKGSGFAGLITNASPYAIPPGAAVRQVNITCDKPGQLTTRGGMLPVKFVEQASAILDAYPYIYGNKSYLLVLGEDGVVQTLESPAYGRRLSASRQVLSASPGTVRTGYTFAYADGDQQEFPPPPPPPPDVPEPPKPLAPDAPSVTVTPVSASAIGLTWGDASIAEGYIVYRWVPSDNSLLQLAVLPLGQTSYTATGLSPSTQYWFRVAAFNSIGQTLSGFVQSTTLSQAPEMTDTLDGIAPWLFSLDANAVCSESGKRVLFDGGSAATLAYPAAVALQELCPFVYGPAPEVPAGYVPYTEPPGTPPEDGDLTPPPPEYTDEE